MLPFFHSLSALGCPFFKAMTHFYYG